MAKKDNNITNVKLSEITELAMNMQKFSNISKMTNGDLIKIVLKTLMYSIQLSCRLEGKYISENEIFREIQLNAIWLSYGLEKVVIDINE